MLHPLPRWAITTRPAAATGSSRLQGVADVLERQPVEAVPAHARVEVFAGQRVHLGNQGGGPVERRVEAGHLESARDGTFARARMGARLWGWCDGASGSKRSAPSST